MEFPRICPVRWLSDQNYGMSLPPHDFLYPFYDMHSNYVRPWKRDNSQTISKEFGSTIENEKENYKISLDVQYFRPGDISVKVTDSEIIVEGKHEERPDTHGFISRQFKRRYALPSRCPPENVTSTMSSDGILIIIAEKRSTNEIEKIVPIKMCGESLKKIQIESKMSSDTIHNSVESKISSDTIKNSVENKISSDTIHNSIKENMKDTEDAIHCKDRTQMLLKEDHCCLLKPELLKEAVSSTNGDKMSSKQVIDILSLSEKSDALKTEATSNKVEESLAKSSLGLSEINEQLGQRTTASTSEMCGMKGMSNISKTVIEESSSSYKSSSSMSSTMKTSGKIGEYVSDIITAELKEAAENI